MNLSDSTVMQLSKAKMRYLGQRQAVLASNVANADTPDYVAKDIKEPDFKSMMSIASSGSQGAMVRTNPKHMLPANQNALFAVKDRAEMDERTPNDNRVNLDEEVQKVAFTQSEYSKVISIYRKNITLYKTALGSPNSGG